MQKTFLLLITLLLLACQPTPEPTNETPEPFEQLTSLVDQYANNTIRYGNINALAVAVYKDGKAYHNYYGKMTSAGASQPNDSTLFEIASISKVFTGSLMARAVAEKKVGLTADIRDFLPQAYPNLAYKGTPITIRDLVTHTLGFETPKKLDAVYQDIFAGNYAGKTIDYDMADLFEELETVELQHEPGTFYDYSNVGPEIVAYILAQVYERPYRALLSDFLAELGLKNTYLQDYDQHQQHLITGHDEEGQSAAIDENPLLGGASGIITTLPDLATFMKYQLTSTAPLIKESTRTLFEDQEEDEWLGYFWDLGYAEKEGFYYYKSGTSNGVQSVLLLCPDSDYGQIIIMNNTSDAAMNDWLSLYNRVEHDLIAYPKINLWSLIEPTFWEDQAAGAAKYRTLMTDTTRYFATSDYLNRVGYDYLYRKQPEKAITVFELAISNDPQNADLYDSLGEAYLKAEDYEKAKANYERSLELDPENGNAVEQIGVIDGVLNN